MEKELTPEDMARQANRLFVEAALMLTRLDRPMKRACKLVLLDGMQPVRAAERVKKPRQHVYRALLSVKAKLVIVKSIGRQ